MRGGIIDVWPPGEVTPVRLDLFGDMLDGARRFDAVTQRTTEKLERVELAPVCEVILDERLDHAVPAELPGRVRCGRHRRSAIRGGHGGPQDARYGALAAVLPRTAGDVVRLPARRDDHAGRSDHAASAGPMGEHHRPIRYAQDGADARRAGSIPSTNLPRPNCFTWTRRLGQRPSPDTARCSSPRCRGHRPGRDRRGRAHRAQLRARTPAGKHEPFRSLGGPYSSKRGKTCRGHRVYSEGARERLAGLLEDEGVRRRKPIADVTRDRPERPGSPHGLAAGQGLHRTGPDGHLGTGRAGRPADPTPSGRRNAPRII